MQALVLVGGEGTRLRPLTSTIPKPAVTLVDRPFMRFMLEWLRSHGIDDVILACGFLPDAIERVLGDGSDLGMRLRYVVEPSAMGTGGAVKFAHELLDERFLVLNGDVLADFDLGAQIAQHERTGAVATLALVPVEDPTAYGLVRLDEHDEVAGFLEKPEPHEIDTDLISAGAYVLERSVLDLMPNPGEPCSIERDVWPQLVGNGLWGYRGSGYWLDIGTPERYLQASFDILDGTVHTEVASRMGAGAIAIGAGAQVAGDVLGPALIEAGAVVAQGARVGPDVVIGRDARVQDGASVRGSVVLERATVGEGAVVDGAILAPDAVVGPRSVIEQGAVIGAGVETGADNVIEAGARLFPSAMLPTEG